MCAASFDSTDRRKIALVIGNSNYRRSPLKNCVNDANDLAKALKSIGFSVTEKTNLDYEEMETEIESFLDSIRSSDLVLFFFSGHGVQHEDKNYLIPCDDNRILGLKDLKHRSINAQRFLELMSDKDPFVIIYLLDCCRTYELPKVSNQPQNKSLSSALNGMAPMLGKAGMLIAFACAPGTVAADRAPNGRNGMFTYHLLQHITRPDEEVLMLLTDVSDGVVSDTNGNQIPYVTSALTKRGIHLAPPQKNSKQSIDLPQPIRTRPTPVEPKPRAKPSNERSNERINWSSESVLMSSMSF